MLCVIAFGGGGGLGLQQQTTLEIPLTLGAGLVAAIAIMLGPRDRPAYGTGPMTLFVLLAALTAVSITWSVAPDSSWQYANRLFAYSALFGAGLTLARSLPRRWTSLLGGVVLASAVICGYALLTKIFPNRVGSGYSLARLEEPYGYWNATGLTAAMGVIGCLWLGSRQSAHGTLRVLSFPALGLMLLTLLLTYSRGALVALVLGLMLWFCVVPRRLSSGVLLLGACAATAPVVTWYLSRNALSADNVASTERVAAGHEFGALLAVMLLLLTLCGLAVGFRAARSPLEPTSRARLGAALLSLPAIAVLALFAALVASHRGPLGTISHAARTLTSPQAKLPSNDFGRLSAISSERARYWEEALEVFKAHPVLGAGADSYRTARERYRTAALDVGQAHGFIVQTLSDLGLVGLATVLALLAAWLAAAGRCTHPFSRQWRSWRWRAYDAPYTAERVGMLTLLCLVVVFGVHSTIDWTWYTPGTACMALLSAGWLCGRGALENTSEWQDPVIGNRARPLLSGLAAALRRSPSTWRRAMCGVAVLAVCVLAAWSQRQPERSVELQNEALAVAASNPARAVEKAYAAINEDPLSADALFVLSSVAHAGGREAEARNALVRAARLQPSNPATWQRIGEYDLGIGRNKTALDELKAAMYLDIEAAAPRAEIEFHPQLLALQGAYIRALRAARTAH